MIEQALAQSRRPRAPFGDTLHRRAGSTSIAGATKFAVLVDGRAVPADNAGGGHVKADVTTTFSGTGGPPHRHVLSYRFTDLRFELGLCLGNPTLNWVNAALLGNPVTKSGTIIEVDQDNRARSYLDFSNAAITEFVVAGSGALSNAENSFALVSSISKSTWWKPLRHSIITSAIVLPVAWTIFIIHHFAAAIPGRPVRRLETATPARPGVRASQ
jgi:hypothetical protein